MSETGEIGTLLSQILLDLLRHYDTRVTDRGMFPDLRAGRGIHFGDPATTLPGHMELVVMSMDPGLDPRFETLRFVSVRVMKSREGGYVSVSCLHGTKAELRAELEELGHDPQYLVERVSELADGLPEETNPDAWR